MIISLQHTNSDSLHGSTAAPIAVDGHNTDSVYHIIGHSDCNTCSTGGDWTEAWTDSDGVVDWSPTIILWRLPLHCEGHIVPTILLNSKGGSLGRGGEGRGGRACMWKRIATHAPHKTKIANYSLNAKCHTTSLTHTHLATKCLTLCVNNIHCTK